MNELKKLFWYATGFILAGCVACLVINVVAALGAIILVGWK